MVTGGAGFIGSGIVASLLEQGHEVCVVDNLDPRGGGRRSHVPQSVRFEAIDICDSERLLAAIRSFSPDAISHQAAQTSVARSAREPAFDASVNVVGTVNVLEAAAASGVRRVVFASSAATYGNVEHLPIDESTPQRPISPYGMTKLIAEGYLRFFARERGLEFTILRYGNVYGPRQNPRGEGGVVAIFTSRFLAGETVQINGDGNQTRDFVYAGDVARANVNALEDGRNDDFVIGTGARTSVNEIYAALARITGKEPTTEYAPRRPTDALESCFNPAKAQRLLNWRARTPLDEGLSQTVSFYAASAAVR